MALRQPAAEGAIWRRFHGARPPRTSPRFQISRRDQDALALRSPAAGRQGDGGGFFAEEIVRSRAGRQVRPEHVAADEHPRPDTTARTACRAQPVFRTPGTVTAGNASGVNDGAAAMIVASAPAVERHGLTPRVRVLGMAAAGVAPRLMGIGPVPATRRLMERLGLAIGDFDVIEINEAFAAQVLACLRELGLADDAPHVNPHGGAIALGHPLGMSGARLAFDGGARLGTPWRRPRACYDVCRRRPGVSLALARV